MNKTKLTIALSLAALTLAACGGGGGGGTGLLPVFGTGTGTGGTGGGSSGGGASDPGTTTPGTNPGTTNPGTDPGTPDPQAKVLLEESFEGLSALPAGWATLAANRGTVSVHDGSLFIDGRADNTAMTSVALPAALQELSNYRIDISFAFSTPNNTGRWGSVMYRTSPSASAIPYDPYYQFAIRYNATASNGTEFALRKAGAWSVQGTKAFSENIDPAKTYTATVIVHGNRVRQYLNGVLTHDASLDPAMAKGGIGLQTAGLIMRVDSIKVTEQLTALPDVTKVVDVQDTGTTAAMAPTLVQSVAAQTTLATTGASNALYTIDSGLNLRSEGGESLGTLAHLFAQTGRATIPVLRIADQATVNALALFGQDHDLGDVTLLSADIDLLAKARTALPTVRTAVDFSAVSILGNTTQDILQVVSATNRAKAKIAVLPPAMTNRATVAHLQRLLITTWTRSDATAAAAAAGILTTGVNGVLSNNTPLFTSVLKQLPANTLLRKPLVIGHRGMPSQVDENTLEGARAAVAAGADAVENDIYMTTDGHLVIMHNDTVDATTNGTGRIESMTLAQVKALRTRGSNYEVPTLMEYFNEFKGRAMTHVVELKSTTAGIVPLLQQELDAAGVKDQVVAISFSGDQLLRMGTTLPDVTVGFLNSNADGADKLLNVRNILNATQQYSSTYNPSYGAGPNQATMEAAKHRGTTFWPWTVNTQSDFYRLYSYGTHGITTDYARWASDFPVAVNSAATATTPVGASFSLPVTLTTQVGATSSVTANQLIVLEGTAAHGTPANGQVSFTAAGTATVLPGYTYPMGDGTYSYTIFGKPVVVTVQ